MSYQGRFQQQNNHPPRKRKKSGNMGLRVTLIVVCVVLALILAGVGMVALYYNHALNQITRVDADPTNVNFDNVADLLPPPEDTVEETAQETTVETTVPETKPMSAEDIINIMVVGNSSREGEDARMADTAILVSINKYTKTVTLSSVLRDSLVQGPTFKDANGRSRQFGKIKFTTCYNLGYKYGNEDVGWAMKVINMVMKDNFGVEVDYNFEVDFDGFMTLVDKIGGVTLELTQAEADYLNDKMDNYLEAEAGPEYLDGYAALTYARMRKAQGDSDSDIKRTSRQRYLIEEIIKTLMTKDLATINSIVMDVLPYVTTNMTNEQINKLLLDLVPMLPGLKIESGTCPVEGTYWGDQVDIYKDGMYHSVLRFDAGQNKKLMGAIAEGQVPAA